MTIIINSDQTLSFAPAQKGRGSMTELSEQRVVPFVNQLSVLELVCCYLLARNGKTSSPLGIGAELYRLTLSKAEAQMRERAQARLDGVPMPKGLLDEELIEHIEEHTVGYWRNFMVGDVGSSFNGPLDSYLEIAAQEKRERSALPGVDVPALDRRY